MSVIGTREQSGFVAAGSLYLALVHYPVTDKNGATIASAVTPINVHDLARVAKTYGLKGVFVVTPLEDQRRIIEHLVAHWTEGYGAQYNPRRGEALELIVLEATFEAAKARITQREGAAPRVVTTSAKAGPATVTFRDLKLGLTSGRPHLLVLGTAWGLAPQFMDGADARLEPLAGPGRYNHLSVRAAAAIIVDRLMAGSNKMG
mgnify:CR=1 FL=1